MAKRGRPRKNPEGVETQERTAKRTPLGVARRKLSLNAQFDGHKCRWINDSGDRVLQARQGGYEHVTKEELEAKGVAIGDESTVGSDLGSLVSKVVGTKEDGSPLRAYLMKIRKEWYEEDQDEKQKSVDEVDRALREGAQYRKDIGDSAYKRDEHSIRVNTPRDR